MFISFISYHSQLWFTHCYHSLLPHWCHFFLVTTLLFSLLSLIAVPYCCPLLLSLTIATRCCPIDTVPYFCHLFLSLIIVTSFWYPLCYFHSCHPLLSLTAVLSLRLVSLEFLKIRTADRITLQELFFVTIFMWSHSAGERCYFSLDSLIINLTSIKQGVCTIRGLVISVSVRIAVLNLIWFDQCPNRVCYSSTLSDIPKYNAIIDSYGKISTFQS